MEMCYDGALVMPSSYAVMDEEEMMYVEGGIGAPNWLVGGAINLAISAAFGGIGSFFSSVAKKAFSEASKRIFAQQLKKKLIAKGIAASLAAGICGFIPSLLTLVGGILDPGGFLAKQFDKRDRKKNNGWCDI